MGKSKLELGTEESTRLLNGAQRRAVLLAELSRLLLETEGLFNLVYTETDNPTPLEFMVTAMRSTNTYLQQVISIFGLRRSVKITKMTEPGQSKPEQLPLPFDWD